MSYEESLTVEWWDIDRPKDYPNNPRDIPESAVDKAAVSSKEFGWQQPLVVDVDEVIIVGHVRRRGGKRAGYTKCPVTVARNLTPEQVAAYRLADNRVGEETSWDQVLLGKELEALQRLSLDMKATAFDAMEVDRAIGIMQGRGVQTDPQAEWRGMPEYERGTDGMFKSVILHFPDEEAMNAFAKLIDQPINKGTKYLWYPKQALTNPSSRVFVTETDA